MRNRMSEMVHSIRRNGEENRAVWDPADIVGLNGWPLTNYLWWRQKTGYDGPENFCHFLRVALFWAPLRWVGSKIDEVMQNPRTFKVFMGMFISAWLGLTIINGTILSAVVGIVLAASLVCGIIVGFHFGLRLFEGEQGIRWYSASRPLIQRAMAAFGAPSALVTLLVYGVFMLIGRLWRTLVWPPVKGAANWFFEASPSFAPWLRPWVVTLGTLAVLSLFSGTALNALVTLAIIATLTSTFVGTGWLISRHEARKKTLRDLRQQAERTAMQDLYLETMFGIVHPEWEGDANRFESWATRYKKWYHTQTSMDFGTFDDVWYIALHAPYQTREQHLEAERLFNQRAAMHTVVEKPVKSRRRIIPLGVVTFFQLVWALVVTNKWKICPVISIPSTQES